MTSRPLLYVSDPSSVAMNLLPDPVRETDLRAWVDCVADAGVDTFCQEVFSQGWIGSRCRRAMTTASACTRI